LAAPQRDSDGKPSVASNIETWYGSVDGKSVVKAPKGTDKLFAMFPSSAHSFWLSASNWYDAPQSNKCPDQSIVTKDECINILNQAMISCDPHSGDTYGATLQAKCIQYVRSPKSFYGKQN